jgi:hypothetical protein
MKANNPNLHSLEQAALALQPLLGELVLVGGSAVGLLVTDPARPPVRATIDVDLATEATPLTNYYALSEKLRNLGFRESGEITCRWTKENLIVDIVPTDKKVLGFTNRWYELAVKMSLTTTLPCGLVIRHISAPLMIASKIESFYGRGKGDFSHHDIEDIINLVDGRPEIVGEVRDAPTHLREFLEQEIDDLLANPQFIDTLPMLINPSYIEQARLTLIIERLRKMAGL